MQETKTSFTLRQSKFVLWVGVIDSIFFLVVTFVAILSTIEEKDYTGAWFCGVVFGSFVALGVILILLYLRQRIDISLEKCLQSRVFGEKKEFMWSEIKSVKHKITNMSFVICLLDEDGKTLAKCESTMVNAKRLLALLKEQNIKIEPLNALGKQIYEEENWKLPEDTSPFKYVAQLRLLNYGILAFNIIAVALLLYIDMPFWLFTGSMVLLPLIPFIPVFMYPKVFVSDNHKNVSKEWKENHVEFAYIAFIIPCIFMCLTSLTVNIGNWLSLVFFTAIISLVAFGIFLFRFHKPQRYWVFIFTFLVFVFMYSFPASIFINLATRTKNKVHTPANVVDTYKSTGRGPTDYTIVIAKEDGTQENLSTSKETYMLARSNAPLLRCMRKSVFGIEIITLHTKSD